MRLVERQYNFLDLANWIVPLGWIYLAHRLQFPTWVAFAGLLLAFGAINYRISLAESHPEPRTAPAHRRPLYFAPGFWLALALTAYLGYLILQSQWLLWTLVVSGTLGAAVASLLRWGRRQPS